MCRIIGGFRSKSDDLGTLSNIFPEAILICSNDVSRLTLAQYMTIFQGSEVGNSTEMVLLLTILVTLSSHFGIVLHPRRSQL